MEVLIYFQVWNTEAKALFEYLRIVRSRSIKIWISEDVHQEWKRLSYMPGLSARDVANTVLYKGDVYFISYEWYVASGTVTTLNTDDIRGLINIMANNSDKKLMVLTDKNYDKNKWTLFRDAIHLLDYPDVFYNLQAYKTSSSVVEDLCRNGIIVFSLDNNPNFTKIYIKTNTQPYYRNNSTGEIWYLDQFHKNHFEVFDSQGKKHLGEADLMGVVDYTKKDSKKQPIM